ncbi:unnamed protein product [Arabidopsis arenosa]|uniref:DUF4283 domain-containing protein n=1 Tax=Arabidopsis arenosa TaxID=38785 RepID=A0A8S2AY78_ARAAE|nr:unnamed protein product [Arabidopsis arenosa]
MKIIPFWVQIQGIPLLYLTNAMARAVGNKLGRVSAVDFDENVSQVGFVRVRLDWNFDDPLRFQRNIQFNRDENTIIKFRFERLRNFCTKCGSLKHDAKECSLVFEDENPADSDEENNGDFQNNANEDQQNNHDGDNAMAEDGDDSLPSVDPATLIPGLQRQAASAFNITFSPSDSVSSNSLSVFEDTELTAERLRYLHAKLTREALLNERKDDFLDADPTKTESEFVFTKRKRVSFETRYNQAEAAEESAALSHFRKKEKKKETTALFAPIPGLAGGAEGPPPQGRSGGLALMWKDNVRLSENFKDERLIDVHITNNNISFYLSCVYGHPSQSERHYLWDHLKHISLTRNDSWLLIGDFNEILSNSEKIGGPPREEWTFREFRNMVSSCDLVDIRSKGDRFSWVGERHTHTVKCCLDRAFINTEAAATFPFAELEFLEFAGSDHKPLLLSMENTATTRTKSFFFDKRLVDIPHFKRCVKEGWENGKTTHGFQIMDQVRTCRHHLSRLKHRSNLNADSRIKELQSQLNAAMSSISRSERQAIPQIQRDLAQAYNDEEKYWHQKSRNNWMIGGDRNTGFFHACTKTRLCGFQPHSDPSDEF